MRQYIGARYQPKFADPAEWDNKRAYEPLTIVLHQGNSYTSRQAVPVGADIGDTNYWLVTGNYNAQIEAYRREVYTYDQRIKDNAAGIVAANNRMDGIDSTISDLDDELDGEIANRQNADNTLDQKIMNEIADRTTAVSDAKQEVLDKISAMGIHNVKDFGAYGDGNHNDAPAIQQALNQGGTIYFPDGTYRIDSTLRINQGDTRLIGGANSELYVNVGWYCIDVWVDGADKPEKSNIYLENLTFRGSGVNGCAGVRTGEINTNGVVKVSEIWFINCRFFNLKGRGIENNGLGVPGSTRYVSNCTFNTVGGIALCNSRVSVRAVDNHFHNSGLEHITFDNGCVECQIVGNYMSGNFGGVGCIGADNINKTLFANNIFTAGANQTTKPGLHILCSTGNSEDITVVGNVFLNGRHSIMIGGVNDGDNHCNYIYIGGNAMRYQDQNPIWCSDACWFFTGGDSTNWEHDPTYAQHLVNADKARFDGLSKKLVTKYSS